MTRFGLRQNSMIETIAKTASYRIYATVITLTISYFIFGIQSIFILLSFAAADIIGGLTTYFTFEWIWITLNGFEVLPTKEA